MEKIKKNAVEVDVVKQQRKGQRVELDLRKRNRIATQIATIFGIGYRKG